MYSTAIFLDVPTNDIGSDTLLSDSPFNGICNLGTVDLVWQAPSEELLVALSSQNLLRLKQKR